MARYGRMADYWMGRIRRGLGTPPRVIARRLLGELSAEAGRFLAPRRVRRLDEQALLHATAAPSLGALWHRLADRPYPAHTSPTIVARFDQKCPGERGRILEAAEAALDHRVDLLRSGPVELGQRVDWHRDYKSGLGWPLGYALRTGYLNPERPSDVKFPWELSRLQWLMPAGLAYLFTGEERYARAVRDLLDDWIATNPYAHSVNWACTMEAVLRILSWTWFFRVFCASAAWAEPSFRLRFLRALFLHAEFTERHLERSGFDGSRFTAAAGLVFAGLFFGGGRAPMRWQQRGWCLLNAELPRQVLADGVSLERSVAYHRLMLELFLLPALYRRACRLEVPSPYRDRLAAMTRFTVAYTRPDGTVPWVGDADHVRALPLGTQDINDHRYLAGVVGTAWEIQDLKEAWAGPRGEVFWLLGPDALGVPQWSAAPPDGGSAAFPHGGFYVMRGASDHVFIDAGPVSTGGRGGHGHNDCLSFDAMLDGVHLVSDCGTYVYTAPDEGRNRSRTATARHTPCVGGEQMNRFARPDDLGPLHDDARPVVRCWQTGSERDCFQGTHESYRRLACPVVPVRTLVLDRRRHALAVLDSLAGTREHAVEIPLVLAPDVDAQLRTAGRLELSCRARAFVLEWEHPDCWELAIESDRVSTTHGVAGPNVRLVWRRKRGPIMPLLICLAPAGEAGSDIRAWARLAVTQCRRDA